MVVCIKDRSSAKKFVDIIMPIVEYPFYHREVEVSNSIRLFIKLCKKSSATKESPCFSSENSKHKLQNTGSVLNISEC